MLKLQILLSFYRAKLC